MVENLESPIIILGASRSGTSLTAGIFANHGVWTGETMKGTQINPKGFFENLRMKQWFRDHGSNPHGFRDYILKTLELEEYNGGKWLFKCGAERYQMWESFKPYYVYCRRDYESFKKSRDNSGFGPMPKRQFDKLQQDMDDSMKRNGGINIYPAKLKEGDFSEMTKALEFCGIEPDMKIIKDFYEPELWHHNESS